MCLSVLDQYAHCWLDVGEEYKEEEKKWDLYIDLDFAHDFYEHASKSQFKSSNYL